MENDKKHFLGHRAFTIFLVKHIRSLLVLPFTALIIWYGERWAPLLWLPWVDYAVKFILFLSIAYALFIIIRTRLEYRCYTYTFTNEAFVITNGLLARNEIAALYHQIQNVNIKRTFMDRMIGVSQLVILMAGLDREGHHTQLTLPGVGKKRAKMLQRELLIRARQHVVRMPTIENMPEEKSDS